MEHEGRLKAALADRYQIEREIGSGGMATVYLAQDLKHNRKVAVKVLNPELAQALGTERFLREIETAANLQHPHILPLFDSGEADGFLFYVMPYVGGESLRARLEREKQLPVEDALRISREVADALSYAHSRGVIHRDIKPANILLEAGHAVVADFGIARAVDEAGGAQLTGTGVALGTPAYMSPEQAAGERELDGRSDLYSLACVLYEMLAGEPPYTGPTVESLIHQHLTAEPPNISGRRPAVSGHVAAALERALSKTPADRFNPVALFGEALEPSRMATVPPAPEAAGGHAPGSPWAKRWAPVAVAAVVVIVGAVALAWPFGKASGPAYPQTAIAVLPFENLSADGPYAFFASGLHGELLTQLFKVAALKPISHTSVLGYAGPNLPPLRQIARELGVGSVVEGMVQVVDGRLRVNVRLIDAATDEQLWSESYDRTLDDAFEIQSDVAQKIVSAVGATLGASERQRLAQAPTANAEAYRLYLQGLDYWRRAGNLRQNVEIAQQLFERALESDSTSALAHAALSQVHGVMWWFSYDTSPERLDRQREAAETALRLAPDLPQAHIAMGRAHYFGRRDWQAALSEYRIALQDLPNDADLWAQVGYVHRRLGNWDEVEAAFQRAIQLNPRGADLFYDLGGITYRLTRRYSDAIAALNQSLILAPDLSVASVKKGWTYFDWTGQLDTLRAVLEHLPLERELGAELGTVRMQRAELLLLERRPQSLLAVVGDGREAALEGQLSFLPASLYAAWAYELRGDELAAQAAFDSAHLLLDSVLVALPDDWRVHAAHGLALAGQGRRQEALLEARWLERSVIYREDANDGPNLAAERACILAQSGEADAALNEIERLLAGPAYLSVHRLSRDPRWDPLRDHPRFQALLEKYADDVEH